MQYTRSEIRHACYRAKNGLITEKIAPILSLVEPLLEEHQNWDNFSKVWDDRRERKARGMINKNIYKHFCWASPGLVKIKTFYRKLFGAMRSA